MQLWIGLRQGSGGGDPSRFLPGYLLKLGSRVHVCTRYLAYIAASDTYVCQIAIRKVPEFVFGRRSLPPSRNRVCAMPRNSRHLPKAAKEACKGFK